MNTTIERSLRRYLDKSEIQDVMLRYARGVDRRDMELLRSVYHADAYDDHGEYKGGIDGLIRWVTSRHANIPQSMHFLGNCLVEFFSEDVALAETYFSRRRIAARSGSPGISNEVDDAESIGRYIDRLERRNGTWRIARRVVVYEAVMTSSRTSPPRNPTLAWARRDAEDVLLRMRDEIMKDRNQH